MDKMWKKIKKEAKQGNMAIAAALGILLIFLVIVMAFSFIHSLMVRYHVSEEMRVLLQTTRTQGYAHASQIEGTAEYLSERFDFDEETFKESISVSTVDGARNKYRGNNDLNGLNGDVLPENRPERGSGDYILVELNYEHNADWWDRFYGAFQGGASSMRHVRFSERIGPEYYRPETEYTAGGD